MGKQIKIIFFAPRRRERRVENGLSIHRSFAISRSQLYESGLKERIRRNGRKKVAFLRALRLREAVFHVCVGMGCGTRRRGLAWNPLTENARGGRVTITTMSTATTQQAVSRVARKPDRRLEKWKEKRTQLDP